ncbi:MAG: hypothetical protein KIS63_20330, partial [Caldilineales bacterium]|nr:hypothetical protein [Caldilineales bacterium]
MNRDWDSRLDAMGARLETRPDAEFHLVEARWQDEKASGDKHHIYLRVLDENGKPIEGHFFRVSNGGVYVDRTKGPGFDDYWGNFPMFAGGAYTVDIPTGASDRVINLPSGTPANRYANTCFFLVFQRGQASPPPPRPGARPPGP